MDGIFERTEQVIGKEGLSALQNATVAVVGLGGVGIFAASVNGAFVGYAVCRIDDDVVWLESVYVKKEYRNKGIATMLLKKCEEVAAEYGNETLYIYINPDNEQVIGLLNKNGYDVLNLIEVRKKYRNEKIDREYKIGDHTYKY